MIARGKQMTLRRGALRFALVCIVAMAIARPSACADVAGDPTTSGVPATGPVVACEKILGFYAQTVGAVFEGIWSAPEDALLTNCAPGDIRNWLETRERQLAGLEAPNTIATTIAFPASYLTELGRASVALSSRDRPPGQIPGVFELRVEVLRKSLEIMVKRGHGPVRRLREEISLLAEDYPDKVDVDTLWVDYVRGLRSIVTENVDLYISIQRVQPPGEYKTFVLDQAKDMELRGLEKLCQRKDRPGLSSMAAMYLARHYWDRGGEKARTALQLITAHRTKWDTSVADREIGDILTVCDGFEKFNFTDECGKYWTVADLTGKVTVVCFYSPGDEDLPSQYKQAVGDAAAVIAVPMGLASNAPGDVVLPKRGSEARFLLREAFHVVSAPSVFLVTPRLEIVSGQVNVTRYIRESLSGPVSGE